MSYLQLNRLRIVHIGKISNHVHRHRHNQRKQRNLAAAASNSGRNGNRLTVPGS